MDPEEDVTAESSPAPDPTSPDPTPSASQVEEPVGDRPARNILGEVDRKFGSRFNQIEQTQAQILALLQQQNQPAQPARQPGTLEDYTDNQLLELHNAGHTNATLELQRRISRQEATRVVQQGQQVNASIQQRNALYQRYPVFADNSHPLTQYAVRAKNLLVSRGADAQNAETDVQAMMLAVTDNPQIIAQLHGNQDEPQRRSTVNQATTLDGATSRRANSRPNTPQLSPREAELAKRYQVKDPARAKANFQKRQDSGQSSLGMVSAFLREE